MLPYLAFWCLSNFSFFHFAGKRALKYKAGRERVNKAYSINIDNNLNKKWECLHHCWVRWIGISMKKAMFNKKQSVLEGEAMDDGRWMHIRLWWHQYACGRLLQGLVYAYVSLDKMAVARNLMCRTSLFCTWTLTDTERWSTKKGGERERERGGRWRCKPVPSGASLRILCAHCWLCSASRWVSSVARGPDQRTRNLQRHIQAGPGTQTQNSPWGRRRWLSHMESLGESP